MSWSELREGLENDPAVRAALTDAIQTANGDALYWECCAWPAGSDPTFEFVLISTNQMVARRTDRSAFAEHFDGESLVHTFASLRGDAMLVVPGPVGPPDPMEPFGHLAAWIRTADVSQIEAVWIAVAKAIAEWRSQKRTTLWVSTAGGGVPWLHVRLDSRPKYYKHAPYRSA